MGGNFLDMANSGVMYLIAGVVVFFVMAMAVVFFIKAYREGIKIGMDKKKMHKAITASVTFTIVPSIGILIGVIALSGALGVPIPWLRLSVIGALHYETMAAEVGAQAAGISGLTAGAMTGDAFVTVIFVMTIGIIWGGVFCIFGLKRYQKTLNKVQQKDNRWGTILFNAMFVGMVCAFIGQGLADTRSGDFTSVIVIVVSALFMALFTWLTEKKGQKWMESFSLSFSMVLGMASAILYQSVILPAIAG